MSRRKKGGKKAKLTDLYKREQQTSSPLPHPPPRVPLTHLTGNVCVTCVQLGQCLHQLGPQKASRGSVRLSADHFDGCAHLSISSLRPQRTQETPTRIRILPLSRLQCKGLLGRKGPDYLPIRFYLPSLTETSLVLISLACMYVFAQSTS